MTTMLDNKKSVGGENLDTGWERMPGPSVRGIPLQSPKSPPQKKKQGMSRDGDQAFAWTRVVCQASL